MNKVSIIIPAYNAEKTIAKCLESLINQTYQNLEIIVINDGSKDNTAKIIKEYQDKRIIFINQSNSGIGTTRNKGIDKSTGDYIMFVDSDDYLALNCIEKLVNNAHKNKSDLVVYNYILKTNTQDLKITIPKFNPTKIEDNPDLLLNINLSPWNKLYHKTLFKNNRFVTNLKYEDAPTVVEAFLEAKKISYEPDYLYYYIMQSTGETLNRNNHLFDILKICDEIKTRTKKYSYFNSSKLIVKILIPYLKNSRYIKDNHLRNKLIKEIYTYLNNTDPKWSKYLKEIEQVSYKRIILSHKLLLKSISNFYALIK